ncbi:MAG: FecR family protein [Elainellaceae cyanobacterium]
MIRKISLTLLLCLGIGLVNPRSAEAVPLTRAIIRLLRNEVNLIPQGRSPRRAAVSDAFTPGDALSTARQSFAEVRFNDGSLARVGESVLFRFAANTRTFRLDNGTVLLLVPPGQGGTRVRTPNATAGIRGSGLFVRHEKNESNPEASVTLVGALTDSAITVCNSGDAVICSADAPDASGQQVVLEAGQMAAVSNGNISVYEMDLETFYETSPLAVGLGNSDASSSDSGIDPRVIEEINQGLADSTSFAAEIGGELFVTPGFSPDVSARASSDGPVEPQSIATPAEEVNSIVTGGEATVDILGNEPPAESPVEPPVVEPPVEPPVVEPPVVEPPVVEPPVEPPVIEPPAVEPPVEPPVVEPPVEPPAPVDPVDPAPDPDPDIDVPPGDDSGDDSNPFNDQFEQMTPGSPDDSPDLDVPPGDDFGDDSNPFNDQFEQMNPGSPDDSPDLDVSPEGGLGDGSNPFNDQFEQSNKR